MNIVENFFKSLTIVWNGFERFLFRDLFAKISPGFLFFISFTFFLSNEYKFYYFFSKFPTALMLILIPLYWIISFAFLNIGNSIKIGKRRLLYISEIYRDNEVFDDINKWIELRTEFHKFVIDNEKSTKNRFMLNDIERLAIIKEASANYAVCILLSGILLFIKLYGKNIFKLEPIILIFLLLIIFISLRRCNYKTWKLQYLQMNEYVRKKKYQRIRY